jgi:hypothetical protein
MSHESGAVPLAYSEDNNSQTSETCGSQCRRIRGAVEYMAGGS